MHWIDWIARIALVGMIEFSVVDWSAWAPGLTSREAWRTWATAPWLPSGDDAPSLPEVPAMQRRRIERLGRMAIQVACWCEQPDDQSDRIPLIFASRHGDLARSLTLLQSLVAGEAVSPTAFGLSVHNAVAALYSIVRNNHGNYLALAAGVTTVEAACVEACGLLADGAPEVRIIVHEAVIPPLYAEFADEPDASYAWCWRLQSAERPGIRMGLSWGGDAEGRPGPDSLLPRGLDAQRFLLSSDERMTHQAEGQCWVWQRHG